ncbi:hypothetical protein [Streptomyces sp. NPDC004065]|uniref:hypothetical protein n=1 Tax=Streptomyces sp. NPDC004065 TaxID=3364689 RepID=UPI00384A86AD
MTDTCPVFPLPLMRDRPDAERGRGLLILDLLADAWGGCSLGESLFGVGGKTIWFELVLGGGDPPPGGGTGDGIAPRPPVPPMLAA